MVTMTARNLTPTLLALALGVSGCHSAAAASPPTETSPQSPAPFASPPVLPGTPDIATLVARGRAEQHVYVQIAGSLKPEAFDEPLRSGIESKGESVLRKLLECGNVPTRIKITSAGITEVGTDRRSRPCSV